MFSCFCAKKKRQFKPNISFNQFTQHVDFNDKQLGQKQNIVDLSSTLKNPKSFNFMTRQNNQTLIVNFEKEYKNEAVKVKQSHKVQEDVSGSQFSVNSSFEQDSQTVPYMSKKQMSQVSTPNKKNFLKQQQKNQSKQKIKQSQVKQSRFYISNEQRNQDLNIFQHILGNQPQALIINSKNSIMSSNLRQSCKGSASIDYSKYSQQDKRITSNQILQLDCAIQEHLNQLDKMPFQEAQIHVYSSSYLNNPNNLYSSLKAQSRFKEVSKFNNIQNDFTIFQNNQQKNNKNSQFSTDRNTIKKSSYKGSLKNVKFQSQEQPKTIIPIIHQEEQLNYQHLFNQLVANTVFNQLQQIQIQQPQLFFYLQQKIPIPENLKTYYKQFIGELQCDQMFGQTLEEAQNSFNCNSINQEFSRAIITKKFSLSIRIFEKMTYQEKNQPDLKGYNPVHLAILQGIYDQNASQIAKKLMYHSQTKMNVKGPTGWSPLQQCISYKNIKLTPNVFVAAHKKKISCIRQSLTQVSLLFKQINDFELSLDVKVDSFIPLLGHLTPNDTITITKRGNKLLIDYTLVGYEYLSCKRRDMGFLVDGDSNSIYAINRSKKQYCQLIQQLDREQIHMLVVQALQSQTKKIQPLINHMQLKQARTIFDNQVTDTINTYPVKKYNFSLNYTSTTQKRVPTNFYSSNNDKNDQQNPLNFIQSWQKYLAHQNKVNIKPKNKNKKIQLQMWLSKQFNFNVFNLVKIFQLFALSNPLAKIISQFLSSHLQSLDKLKDSFPVKIDVPINFSLFFNIEFRDLKFTNFKRQNLQIQSDLKKITRKQFQNIAQSKQKRSFAISGFT